MRFYTNSKFQSFEASSVSSKSTQGSWTNLQGYLITKNDVFLSSPEDLESCFRINERQLKRFKLEPFVRGRKLLNLNKGISNAQGEECLRVRKLYNEYLLTNKSIWMYTKQQLEVSFDLLNYIEQSFDEMQEVPNFQNASSRWALECATVFATNTKLGVFEKDLSFDTKLFMEPTLNLFTIYAKLITSLPLWKYFNTKDVQLLKLNQSNQINPMNKIFSRTSVNGLSRFQTIVANSDLNQSEKDVVFTDILGAGIDTTSNAASFVLYCLATNPEKQNTLRREIQEVINSGQEITGKTLQQMKYLHAVSMEAQRLYPLVIGIPQTLLSVMVLSGYHVPAGSSVFLTSNIVNNRDPKYFDNPDSFIPEQWLNRNKENRFVATGSFGIGARMCPGRRFALQKIGCLAIALLSRYKIEYHHEPIETIY